MGTTVTIQLVRTDEPRAKSAVERAFGWFYEIESRCTRFDESSELRRLSAQQPGTPVTASPILFEAVRFALEVAAETKGAFDPTMGHTMETRGYNREHRTGRTVQLGFTPESDVSYRDVEVDAKRHTITLRRPLALDLGAVAKGLAVDTAARELTPFRDFSINAGGDLFLSGKNPDGEAWSVGIRHPRIPGEIIETLRVSNQAVCTSGDYERGEHLLDPRSVTVARAVASATVVAPNAMLADALATAAFILGPTSGIAFLDRVGVAGLIFTPELERSETKIPAGVVH